MLHRMAGDADITALRVLVDVVEPVKDYNRWDDAKGPIDFHAPLTRMIDAAYPESDTAAISCIWCRHTFRADTKIGLRRRKSECGSRSGATTTPGCIHC